MSCDDMRQIVWDQKLEANRRFAQHRRKSRDRVLGRRGRWFESSRPDQSSSPNSKFQFPSTVPTAAVANSSGSPYHRLLEGL